MNPVPKVRASGMFRAAMFYAFAQELRRMLEGEVSTQAFKEAVKEAIDVYGVEPRAISSKFGVTPATISRWRNGEAAPGHYVRQEVVAWLADRLQGVATEDELFRSEKVVQLIEVAERI